MTFVDLERRYRYLLVDAEDDGSFEICHAPQCRLLMNRYAVLRFRVDGFSSYKLEENTDPSLLFAVEAIQAELQEMRLFRWHKESINRKLAAAGPEPRQRPCIHRRGRRQERPGAYR